MTFRKLSPAEARTLANLAGSQEKARKNPSAGGEDGFL